MLYDRNNLTGPMLSGRKHLAEEFPGKYSQMQRAPTWRLWTGVAFATLVVWLIL
ncbi:MAG: hypothetical protein ACREXP_11195 [Steroidobacteraceae bacterium]